MCATARCDPAVRVRGCVRTGADGACFSAWWTCSRPRTVAWLSNGVSSWGSVCLVGCALFRLRLWNCVSGCSCRWGLVQGKYGGGAAVRSVGVEGWAWAVRPPQAEPPVGVARRSA